MKQLPPLPVPERYRWFVWSPERRHYPGTLADSQAVAEEIAGNLATKFPGCTYHVLGVVASFKQES